MASKKTPWTVKLYPNAFTPDNDRDQLATVVQNEETKHDEDVADEIIAQGIELKRATILDVLSRRNDVVKGFVLSGKCYSNEIAQYTPRVTGVFETEDAKFDPAIHKCVIDMSAGSALRAGLSSVTVVVDGTIEAGGAKIGSVTNSVTGLKDGTIPVGDDIIIEGDKIKIQDEADSAQGVFIIDSEGKEHRVTRRLTDNKPSRLTARVPSDVPAGDVQLIVRTKYAGGGTVLKNIRELKYSYSLKAID